MTLLKKKSHQVHALMHKASKHLQSIQHTGGESWKKKNSTSTSKNSHIWKYSLGAQEEVFPALTVTVGGSLCSHSSSCRSRSCPSSPASPSSAARGLRGARLGNAARHRESSHRADSTDLLIVRTCSAVIPPSHNHLGGKGPPGIYSGSARSRLSQQSLLVGFEDLPRLSMEPVPVFSVKEGLNSLQVELCFSLCSLTPVLSVGTTE